MKRQIGIVACVLCAGAALAQMGEVGAGLMVAGDSDHLDTGVGIYGFAAARPVPVFSIRGTLAGWEADPEGDLQSSDGIFLFGLEGSMVLHYGKQTERIHLWAGGGVGLYSIDAEDDWHDPYEPPTFSDAVEYEFDDEVGFHALAGVDLIISGPFSFYVEGKYLFLESDVERVTHSQTATAVTQLGEMNFDTPIVNFGFKAVF